VRYIQTYLKTGLVLHDKSQLCQKIRRIVKHIFQVNDHPGIFFQQSAPVGFISHHPVPAVALQPEIGNGVGVEDDSGNSEAACDFHALVDPVIARLIDFGVIGVDADIQKDPVHGILTGVPGKGQIAIDTIIQFSPILKHIRKKKFIVFKSRIIFF
jgi:hypothetical protein